ncbi:MAG: C1 family peptidase [Dongiaceae bacterium]
MSLVIACDLRPSFGAIRNQGSRPTCVAFAISDAHAVVRSAFVPLSVEHLYYHAIWRTPGGRPEDGVSLPRILEALRLDGQAVETGWPYMDLLPADLTQWLPPATATPVFKRASVTGTAAMDAIVRHLDAGTPVVVTFLASLAFCSPDNGIVRPQAWDSDVDWHAVVAVGHAQSGSERLLLVRNSWGEPWGLSGHAWVDPNYLAPRLSGFATMAPPGSV